MSSVAFVNNFTFNFNNSCASPVRALNALPTTNNNNPVPVDTTTSSSTCINSSVEAQLPPSHSWPSWPPSTSSTPTITDNQRVEDNFDVLNYASMSTPKKIELVRDLIDITADILGNIWGKPEVEGKVLPLNVFVQETIKRSQSSYCTLLTALLYIFRIKSQILRIRKSTLKIDLAVRKPNMDGEEDNSSMDRVLCARRMFLAALILASKFLQDRNYTNGAWAKTLGLNVADINVNESAFLRLIDYRLFVSLPMFSSWSNMCMKFIQTSKAKNNSPDIAPVESLRRHTHNTHARSGPYPVAKTTNQSIAPNSKEFITLLRIKAQQHREMMQSLQSSPARLKQQQAKHIHQLPSPSASP
ncbi:hypothetical protein K493DRAFT_6491 [Basidiobolus meristosporus CBS 931.73]|uniref:Cyclin-domain-containing protein n=1 Tax=Basidiobolus meristosporus CBS 931.73 TaxID=1314790 RepID=A0A1Y1VZK5_9FUNG|nr:hypothetical protein K493DRAFT_6491 [Basidiobolus meristosporus CBS 931.73]|eukprot:ORX66689.1 hypothetical protein K493DRAFT_6491 [Basidiobolus meristosporus CBS 931.73]